MAKPLTEDELVSAYVHPAPPDDRTLPDDDVLVDVATVAGILGIHTNTTKRLEPAELPYYRVGSRGDRRYRLGDVRAYLRDRRVG